jgi:hypothetical protein
MTVIFSAASRLQERGETDQTKAFAFSTFIGGIIPRTFISWYISKILSIVSTNPVQPSRRAYSHYQHRAKIRGTIKVRRSPYS